MRLRTASKQQDGAASTIHCWMEVDGGDGSEGLLIVNTHQAVLQSIFNWFALFVLFTTQHLTLYAGVLSVGASIDILIHTFL